MAPNIRRQGSHYNNNHTYAVYSLFDYTSEAVMASVSNNDIMKQLKNMAGTMATKKDVEELKSLMQQKISPMSKGKPNLLQQLKSLWPYIWLHSIFQIGQIL